MGFPHPRTSQVRRGGFSLPTTPQVRRDGVSPSANITTDGETPSLRIKINTGILVLKHKSKLPQRRSLRLRGYDYSRPGAYFVTICIRNQKCIFGEIINGNMHLNEIGNIVVDWWNRIPQHFPSVEINDFVIMPNHIHGIISWHTDVGTGFPCPSETVSVGTGSPCPSETVSVGTGFPCPSETVSVGTGSPYPKDTPSLGKIVGYFKYQSTKFINKLRKTPGKRIWQTRYHDHIIRNDKDLQRLREYIQNNPKKWELDQLHPNNKGWDTRS